MDNTQIVPAPSWISSVKRIFITYIFKYNGRCRRCDYLRSLFVYGVIAVVLGILTLLCFLPVIGSILGVFVSSWTALDTDDFVRSLGSMSGLAPLVFISLLMGILLLFLNQGLMIWAMLALLSASWRRMHDIGMPGIIAIIPITAIIIFPIRIPAKCIVLLLILVAVCVLMCLDSKPEANKWGASPKYSS